MVKFHMNLNHITYFRNTLKYDKDRLRVATLTFDFARLNSLISNTSYQPETIYYDYLKQRVNDILDPVPPEYTSDYSGEKNLLINSKLVMSIRAEQK